MSTTEFYPVEVNGKALVVNGNRFMVNGVCLQPGEGITDYDYPLSDSNYDYTKNTILPYLKELHVNMIRVYQVDLTASHDQTMQLLQDNGIYVMLEIEDSDNCVQTLEPKYSYSLYLRGTQVVDIFQKYPNTMAFSVGNETENPGLIYSRNGKSLEKTIETQKEIASALKSFIRDMKAYMSDKNYRAIPVGVAIRDVFQKSVTPKGAIGTDVCAEYYAAGPENERADFIGLNTYRYVSAENPDQDPLTCYNAIATDWAGMPVPVVFSEIGGISAPQTWPRDWACINYMYETELLYNQFSGQVAFSFFNEKNDLGLYIQKPNQGGDFSTMPLGGVDELISQFNKVKDKSVPMPATSPGPTTAPATCNPALQPPFFKPETTITVMNYATVDLKVVQGEVALGSLTAAPNNQSPTTNSVKITTKSDLDLYVLQPDNNWALSCKLPADNVETLTDNSVINNQNWGESCNIG